MFGLTRVCWFSGFLLTLLVVAHVPAAEIPFLNKAALDSSFLGVTRIVAGDIDGDGDFDLAGGAQTGGEVRWWENASGDGSSWSTHTVAASVHGKALVLADIDDDGDLDLAGAQSTGDRLAWWENLAGDGSSWNEHTVGVVEDGLFIAAVDIDGDADFDLVSAASAAHEVAWWENSSGDGSLWQKHTVDSGFLGASAVTHADLDRDGDTDLLGTASAANLVAWWENINGDGSAWSQVLVSGSFGGATAVGVADLDRDGDLDVVGAAEDDNTIAWWENMSGDGASWSETTLSTTFDGASSVRLVDLDKDGDWDVLGTASQDDSLAWWENVDNAESWIEHLLVEGFDGASSALAMDLDRDGDLDVFGSAMGASEVAWWINDTIHRNALFVESGQELGNAHSYEADFGDLDGDGDLDAYVTNGRSTSDTIWFLDRNQRTFVDSGQALDARTGHDIELGDLDGDGDLDAFVANGGDEGNGVWFNEGGVFSDSGQSLGNLRSSGMALGDIDGDGDLDAVVANGGGSRNHPNIIWLNNGSGFFVQSSQILGARYSNGVALGDLDSDGDLDAFVANLGPGSPNPNEVWINQGGSQGGSEGHLLLGQTLGNFHSRRVALGDLDGDGDLDAFVTNDHQANKVWLNTGSGFFTSGTSLAGTDNAVDGALGDVDQDGDLDALVSIFDPDDNTLGGDTLVWLNDGFASFTETQRIEGTSARGIDLADLDGDGDLDLFAARDANSPAPNRVWFNHGGQFGLGTTDLGTTSFLNGETASVLAIEVTHLGLPGEQDVELDALELLLEESLGDHLSQTEATSLFESLHIYRDEGSGSFDAADLWVATTTPLNPDAEGRITIGFTPGDPLAAVAQGAPQTYFVVVELTDDASIQTPSSFQITHVTESSSSARDREHDVPLSLQFASNVASNPMTVVGPHADLSVNLAGSVDLVQAGDNLIYTVTVANQGLFDASDVVLDTTLDSELTLESTAGCAEDPSGAPSCSLGTIPSGASRQVVLTTIVAPTATGILSTEATVTSTSLESNPGDESATLETEVQQPCVANLSGLAVWWPGDGDASDAIGANHGDPQYGAGFGVGQSGQAFLFDGFDDLILVPDSPELNFGHGQDFAIEAWVYLQNPTVDHDDEIVKKFGLFPGGFTAGYRFGVQRNSRQLFFRLFDGIAVRGMFSTSSIQLDTWTHVAAVRQGSMTHLYIDGLLDTSELLGDISLENTTPLSIGGFHDTRISPPVQKRHSFGGLIDEIGIYRRALSGDEIQAIHSAGSHGKCELGEDPGASPCRGAVGHWPFNDAEGVVAEDGSGSSNDGKVDGAALWTVGQLGGALEFDGVDDSVGITDLGAGWPLDLGERMTLSTWVYLSAVDTHQMLISKDDAYELEVGLDGPGVYTLRLNNIRAGHGETPLKPYTWYHLTATWDGSTVRYYLNGQPDGSVPFLGTLAQNDNTLGLGARYHAWPQICDRFLHRGILDEVCLFDRTLTDSEVLTLFEDARPDVEPPLRSEMAPVEILPTGSSPVTLSVVTDEPAECRFSMTVGVPFEAMASTFQTLEGTSHTATLMGLADEVVHRYSVRCQDIVGNTNLDDQEILFALSSSSDLSEGLRAHLALEEGIGCTALDSSGQGAEGNLGPDCEGNAPNWGPGAISLSSVTLDGQDDQITVETSSLGSSWTEITMSAWIRHPPSGLFRSIFDRREAGDDGFDLYLANDSKLFVRINSATARSETIVADGRWHHVAATYDGASLALYVDGRLDSQQVIGGTLLTVDADLLLGRHWSNLNHTFAGQLDEVRLYDRALSAAEVLGVYLETALEP